MSSSTRMPGVSRRHLVLALGAMPLAARAAFPDKPIRLVVPFPAGGAADLIARGLGQHLGTQLGQQVIIENRAGAGGAIGAELVARAPADGYTLLLGTMGTHAINPALSSRLRYEPVKDFAPIALTHITPRVLLAGPSLNVRTVAEFIARARSSPGKITYGSAGNGSSGHLCGALFESMSGVDIVHVPYKGSAPLATDLLGGRIDCTFDAFPVYEEHLKAGRVRALAVTSRNRMSALPDTPTLSESGLAGYDVSNWQALLAPAGTPREVVLKLHAATLRALSDAGMKRQLSAQGIETTSSSPEELATLIRNDIAKWVRIVKASGAQIE